MNREEFDRRAREDMQQRRGQQAAPGWLKWLLWGGVALLATLGGVLSLANWMTPVPPLQPSRQQLVQSAINRGEQALMAHIQASMHDPGSFQLVDDRALDAGDHITMVMTYRGRNGFNALRVARVSATLDLHGNITSVQEIE